MFSYQFIFNYLGPIYATMSSCRHINSSDQDTLRSFPDESTDDVIDMYLHDSSIGMLYYSLFDKYGKDTKTKSEKYQLKVIYSIHMCMDLEEHISQLILVHFSMTIITNHKSKCNVMTM